ncbi:endoglycosylceramidase [Actinocorallia herbida]|uniref:Endoglycosylceramidase n=1 Tax=Actinocorallia herbida TaxID=58109 RepID=A0A3N1CZD5_9ACTN|nr:cellulase family glycosylhydrolase [Actinocorallia herbida]ROO86645.1 endoglycosylceramidase [Actinocorallia herbida]
MTLRALLVTGALVLSALWAPAPVGADSGWTLPRLTVEGRVIKDVTGRTVLLRGVNVNQLNDYADNGQDLPTVVPLDRTDFAEIAALGFNVVRLNLAWSALEPTPGAFDPEYVARIRQAVGDAADHGLYTVLDMHQDAWGKTVGTPPGKTCPSGTVPGIGWDGAPAWATRTDGWSTCTVLVREVSPAVARAFQHFYDDTDGVQTHLVRTWGRLAAEFRDEPAVAGYDLLNEPNPGLRTPVAAARQIGAFYRRAIDEIRAAETGGFPHLVIFEPSVLWSGFGLDALPPRASIADPLAVFSPHLYNESITVAPFPSIETGFALADASAAFLGVPLWTGEWGWFGDPATDRPKVDRFLDALDTRHTGGAWWSWKQACGDPHAVRDANTHDPQNNLSRIDCPSGTSLGVHPDRAAPLSRPYPRALPGTALKTTPTEISGTRHTGSCLLEAWYPTRPTVLTTRNLTDLQLTELNGGWRLTACATSTYTLKTT